ncbi:hypothetical protein HDV05_008234, partial [Chytridiales sp. JEL 0842]
VNGILQEHDSISALLQQLQNPSIALWAESAKSFLLANNMEKAEWAETNMIKALKESVHQPTSSIEQVIEVGVLRMRSSSYDQIEASENVKDSYSRLLHNLSIAPALHDRLVLKLDTSFMLSLVSALREAQLHANEILISKMIEAGTRFIQHINSMPLLHRNQDLWSSMIRFYTMCIQYNRSRFTKPGAIALFEEFQLEGYRPNLKDYNHLLRQVANQPRGQDLKDTQSKRVEQVTHLLESMKRAGLIPNSETYSSLFIACSPDKVSSLSPHPSWTLFEESMLDQGLQHTPDTLYFLLKTLLSGKLFDEAIQRFTDARLSNIPRDLRLYNLFFKFASQTPNSAKFALYDLRHSMARESSPPLKPNVDTYAHLMGCCVKSKDIVMASQLVREMEEVDGLVADDRIYGGLLKLMFLQKVQGDSALGGYVEEVRRLVLTIKSRGGKVKDSQLVPAFNFFMQNLKLADAEIVEGLFSLWREGSIQKLGVYHRLKDAAELADRKDLQDVLANIL